MTLTPGDRLGPYEILASIGAGGMGEVYRAKDSRLGRVVAIKILPQHLLGNAARRRRFEREAQTASRLSHPHICSLYDVGEHDQHFFIVMELLEGETLADRLRRGPLPLDQILRIAIDVADALHHAHRAGTVHRDLKPANIMLTRTGAKLLDFGVARLGDLDEADGFSLTARVTATESLTEAGTILGTLHYMAPEQLEGKEADPRSDVFALGAVVYEMVTGRQAFEGASKASLIAAILERTPPPISSVIHVGRTDAGVETMVPPALDHVVSRCLAKDPDERWHSAADVRQELKWIAEGHAPTSPRPPRARRRLLHVAVIAAAFLAAAAVALALARSGWLIPKPVQPTFKQLTFRRGTITEARFGPDGQSILYSAGWDGGPMTMELRDIRSRGPESRSIPPTSAGLAAVSRSNELALLLGCTLEYGFCVGTLARMPLSSDVPRPLLENVVSADWNQDGQRLAAIHKTEGEYRVEFPIGKTLHRSKGRLNSIRFAPEDDRLAFLEFPGLDDEVGTLKVIDLQGQVKTVSTGWKSIRGLQWSPDGTEIWFTASRTGKSCSLYAVSLSGKLRLIFHAPGDITLADVARDGRLLIIYGAVHARMIWSGDKQERDLSWFDWPTVADISSDGQTVLFHETGEAANASPAVYIRRVDGSDAVKLGEGKALALSPDGRWALALIEGDRMQLLLHPIGAGEGRVLPSEDVTDVYWARWFPDSRRILLVAEVDDGVRTFIQDVDTGQRQPMGDTGTLGLLVHPDGQRILARDAAGYSIWPIQGGKPALLRDLEVEYTPFQWSTDPGILYVRSGGDDVVRVYRHSLATGRRELWREIRPRDPAGVIGLATGRGELAITPDGRAAAFTYWTVFGDLFLVDEVR